MSVDTQRLVHEFVRLTSFDAPSFQEREISAYVKEKLQSLGLQVEEDNARQKLLEEDPSREKTGSNLYAYLKGDLPGAPILFSAHLDTVSPGMGKKAILQEDGRITSDGTTVLGADDVSGLASILEALTLIREEGLSHPDLEILITVAEEPYCSGSRFVEYDRLKAKEGYVLDLVGPVGTAATAAPSILSLRAEIRGKAAHAGFSPEKGINALSIAADALASVRTGRVAEDLTVNFGTIRGGSGRNVVPEEILLEGEIRCLDHEKALCEADLIRQIFEKAAKKYGGSVQLHVEEHIRSYGLREEKSVVQRFLKAVQEVFPERKAQCITTYGGSDANRLNANGIDTIVLACAMENCHGTDEYTTVPELTRAAQVTLQIMTQSN